MPPRTRVNTNTAIRSTAITFAINGLTLGSWVSRIPAARDTLELTTAQMGTLLLAPGIGAIIGMPIAGHLVAKVGTRRGLFIGAIGTTTALVLMIIGLALPFAIVVAAGLGLYGIGISQWDVAMNVAGSELEHERGGPVLPWMHASLSLGTIVGSVGGVAGAAVTMSVSAQLIITAAIVAGGVIGVAKYLPEVREPGRNEPDSKEGHISKLSLFNAWKESRTVLIGLTILAFALCEGIAGNWLALTLVDGHHTSEATGALSYAIFVSALTIGRAAGGSLITRLGRVMSLRLMATIIVAGVLLVVSTASLLWILIGCALWGLGTSLGFPVGMSAASDDPRNAAIRVSVVSWIGYGAFFCGPPLVAYLIELVGPLPAILSAAVAGLLAICTARAVRPLA